jgi:hypothetical protein
METLKELNARLIARYSTAWDNSPIYRIVWSDDQFETREVTSSDAGIQYLTPIFKEVPKYRHYIQHKYILEKFVEVPEQQQKELAGKKVNYEPLWTFEDRFGNALIPKWEVCELVIHTVQAAMGRSSLFKYVDPDSIDPVEKRQERIEKLEKEMFGNETNTGDALAHGFGVALNNMDMKE